jgi:hypothetical protein
MSAAHCSVSGEGARRAVIGDTSAIELILREGASRPLTVPIAAVLPLVTARWLVGAVGDVVDETAMRATALSVVAASNGAAGAATVRYTWPDGSAAGPRRLSLAVGGVAVPSSPLTVQVVNRV